MEKTTHKLLVIVVISAVLLVAIALLDGLIAERRSNHEMVAAERVVQVDKLAQRIDFYRLTERSSKYAALFLLITFGGCFLFETLRGLRVHAVQYFLIGAAVAIFFLLLLSLGEQMGFNAAYVLAAVACNGLIVGYLRVVLGGLQRALALGAMLAAAYAVMFVLLHTAEFTLLIGSLLLFAALAAVMFFTRHFDWYALQTGRGGNDGEAQ